MPLKLLDRAFCSRRRGCELHILLMGDDGCDALTEQRVIVNDENANALAHCLSIYGRSHAYQCLEAPSTRGSYAVEPGTIKFTSVPAPSALITFSSPLILSVRSRIPDSPQCPSRPERTTSGSMPQ